AVFLDDGPAGNQDLFVRRGKGVALIQGKPAVAQEIEKNLLQLAEVAVDGTGAVEKIGVDLDAVIFALMFDQR
ncbi:MAG: hypothetical protein JZU63_11050, partial [Rhodoferax sp.]|nr:hypothetical protein [Rhodoferax sp.]